MKEIWVQTESKKYLTPERFEHTRNGADREVESMTALTAEETAKMILNENESKINENKISKLWETNIDKGSGQQLNDIWEPEKVSYSTQTQPAMFEHTQVNFGMHYEVYRLLESRLPNPILGIGYFRIHLRMLIFILNQTYFFSRFQHGFLQ